MESGEYGLVRRFTDSGFINVIKREEDTLVVFSITYLPRDQLSRYTRLWDGIDTTTIMPLPEEWNNNREDANVFIKGTMDGNAFTMQSLRERAIKNFFVNDRLALSVYGKKFPARALQFQQLSPTQIKLFTILSSLPYSYFNYPPY
jgi:hypothetical protein